MSGNIDWANAESSEDEEEVPQVTSEAPPAEISQPSNDARNAPTNAQPRVQSQQFTAMVGNLAYKTSIDTIGNFFVDGGCRVKDVRIPVNEEGKSRGLAYVDFEDQASLELALTASGQSIDDREIKVSVAASRSRKESGPGPRGGGGAGRGPREHREGRGAPRERDYGSRYRDAPGDSGGAWTRTSEQLPPPPPRERRDREPRDKDGPGRVQRERPAATGPGDSAPSTAASAARERPKLTVLPRTLPIEFRAPQNPSSDIFGGGKPRDATTFEKKEPEKVEAVAKVDDVVRAEPVTAPVDKDTDNKARPREARPVSGRGAQKRSDRVEGQPSAPGTERREGKSNPGRGGGDRDGAGRGGGRGGSGRGSSGRGEGIARNSRGEKSGRTVERKPAGAGASSTAQTSDAAATQSSSAAPAASDVPKKVTKVNMFDYLVQDEDNDDN